MYIHSPPHWTEGSFSPRIRNVLCTSQYYCSLWSRRSHTWARASRWRAMEKSPTVSVLSLRVKISAASSTDNAFPWSSCLTRFLKIFRVWEEIYQLKSNCEHTLKRAVLVVGDFSIRADALTLAIFSTWESSECFPRVGAATARNSWVSFSCTLTKSRSSWKADWEC